MKKKSYLENVEENYRHHLARKLNGFKDGSFNAVYRPLTQRIMRHCFPRGKAYQKTFSPKKVDNGNDDFSYEAFVKATEGLNNKAFYENLAHTEWPYEVVPSLMDANHELMNQLTEENKTRVAELLDKSDKPRGLTASFLAYDDAWDQTTKGE